MELGRSRGGQSGCCSFFSSEGRGRRRKRKYFAKKEEEERGLQQACPKYHERTYIAGRDGRRHAFFHSCGGGGGGGGGFGNRSYAETGSLKKGGEIGTLLFSSGRIRRFATARRISGQDLPMNPPRKYFGLANTVDIPRSKDNDNK